MSGEALGLAVLGAVLLGAALAVVLSRNLFHSILWLALALVAVAGLFLLLHAEFLALVQVLLYAGGVVTLVVFAIMLTERLVGQRIGQMTRGLSWGALVAVTLFAGLAWAILRAPARGAVAPGAATADTAGLGRALLTTWVLPFEILAILLVAALLGALYLARVEE